MKKINVNSKPEDILKQLSKPISNAMRKELQAAPGFKPFISSLVAEASPTPRSKWYPSKSQEWCISQVRALLSDLANEGALGKEISEDDLKAESKVGPQGGHPAFVMLIPKLLEYFDVYVPILKVDDSNGRGFAKKEVPDLDMQRHTFSEKEWSRAKSEVRKMLHLEKRLTPMAYRNVVDKLKTDGKLITNCGYVPGVSFRRRNRPEVIKRVLDLQHGDNWKQPAIIGERSTRGKTRFIFMTSFATNVHGAAYSMVLQDYLRSLNLPALSAWEGNQLTRRAITSMLTKEKTVTSGQDESTNHETFLSSDFTGMDQRFNLACMLEVFDVIKWGFQEKYWKELEEIVRYVANTPIIFPTSNGELRVSTVEHSLISGAEWTNLFETIFALIMWTYVKAKSCRVLGDDGVAISPWPEGKTAESFSTLCAKIGMTGNPAKQLVSDRKVHYLQRYYYNNYWIDDAEGQRVLGGVYPLMLALNSLMNPERFHDPRKWNARMVTIRNLMITENTCDHPKFKQFAEFVGKGDKYLKDFLKLSKPQLEEVENQARSIPGFIPSYNQEKVEKRIWQFETFKVWKAMKS